MEVRSEKQRFFESCPGKYSSRSGLSSEKALLAPVRRYWRKGVSKPGEIVWSRVFVENGKLNVDLGRGKSAALPTSESERRWAMTTPQWPMMNAALSGVSRDQFMARHKSNHIQIAYAPDSESARSALSAKAAMMAELGIEVNLCGNCLL